MAHMLPNYIDRDGDSGGEIALFDLFSNLPEDYYIFHSVPWIETRHGSRQRVFRGEADFLVLVPDRGLISFEVKDGDISYTRETGWLQTNRRTHEQTAIDPFGQARRSMFFFLKVLKESFGGHVPFQVCSAVWFTSIESGSLPGSLPHECSKEITLTADDMANHTSINMALHRVLTYHGAQQQVMSPENLEKALTSLMPEFRVFATSRGLLSQSERMFHRMTREQSTLLDYLEEQQTAAIKGIAGTGKTILAVEKAKRLALDGEVLFLCFNTYLKNHLEETYRQPGITFTNLDTLLVRLSGRPLPLEQHNPGEKDNRILEMLFNWDDYRLPFEHFVVDEGQDFVGDHLTALHEIAKRKNGCFYVFYDAYQFVQGSEFPEWLRETDCRLVLSRNCRNTKEIALTSTKPVNIDPRGLSLLRDSSLIPSAAKPSITFVKNAEETKVALLHAIKDKMNKGLSLDRIVVLTPGSTENSAISSADMRLAPGIQLSLTPASNRALFTSVRRFKGLEADAVILLDVDWQTFSTEAQRRAFYVGSSRAKIWLDIIAKAADSEEMARLATAMTGEAISPQRCRVAIANWLQVVIK